MLGFLFGRMPQGLTVKVVKKPCAFVLHIESPLDTLKRLAMFFEERSVIVERMQMNRYNNGNAILTVQCMIDKDSIEVVVRQLSEMPGVREMERLGATNP
jgi:hypothetical protein